MALRKIVTSENPLLRKKSRPVENFDDRLWQLLEDMRDTLIDNNGVGIAAVQVGVLRRAVVILIDEKDGIKELINPEIIESEGVQDGKEGCLSYPGEVGMVVRPMKVKFRAQDRFGHYYEETAQELYARAVCHELDHLNGKTFVDIARDVHFVSEEDEEIKA